MFETMQKKGNEQKHSQENKTIDISGWFLLTLCYVCVCGVFCNQHELFFVFVFFFHNKGQRKMLGQSIYQI